MGSTFLSVAPIARTIDAVSFPGVTEESRATVKELLEENNKKHHIFFNNQRYHNHVVHHILDSYSLGSTPARLREIYDEHLGIQRPLPKRVSPITTQNWTESLGKIERWTDYLDFYNNEIKEHGVQETIDKYFFHPQLFGRMMSGVLHPIIHLGFGVEFRLPMIVSEALAQGSLHLNQMGPLMPQKSSSAPSTPLLELLEQIINDQRFGKLVKWEDASKSDALLQNGVDVVKEYLDKWNVAATETDIKAKQKELYECIILMYAAVVRPGKLPMFDFFLMHSLTSSLFVHVLLQHFSLEQQALLLKAHFSVTLLYYIARGRPKFYTENLKNYKTKLPANPNRWVEAIKFAVTTPDTHALKVIRALMQAEQLYGESEGIFLKAAEITADTFAHTGSDIVSHSGWDQEGIGYDENWADRPNQPKSAK